MCLCERLIVRFRCCPDSVIALTFQCRQGSPGHLTTEVLGLRRGGDSVLRVVAWGHDGFSAVLSELKLLLGSPAGRQNIEAKDESQRAGQQAGNGQVVIG